ncbi:MAG: hydrogenase nickel incorporation protein HypB [Alphaproteobacteria bacterium]|nr:hydrogenase nickel incorporation protein HypB [Alphaproteobacteria bacterium]MCB9696922.1 hydrogenase nickel incorporation protein HypB [Alphaproteobacteria bacterium]
MCTTCGCSGDRSDAVLTVLASGERVSLMPVLDPKPRLVNVHAHHAHAHDQGPAELIELERRVLATNDRLAERNRAWLAGREVLALNLMSSPGSGKTTLLERTLAAWDGPCGVLEGDQETTRDADRIRATGTPVVQVNTGKGCHLEADMVWQGLQRLQPPSGAVLFVENVGNLVCPALFDLGEEARVVLFSVTEGEDKPEKYPHMFRGADLVLLTKVDLLPHLDFDVDASLRALHTVNPRVPVLQISARTGEGMEAWVTWIRAQRAQASHGWSAAQEPSRRPLGGPR